MMKPSFTDQFFANNRRRLRKSLTDPNMLIAISANGLVQRGGDSPYAFAQDANFWYLSGINEPDIVLVMDGDQEFLIVPIREGARVSFDGQIDTDLLSTQSGITDIMNEARGWKRLDELVKSRRKVATFEPAPTYIEAYGMYANPARQRFIERLTQHSPGVSIHDLREQLALQRMIKQPVELQAIEQAIAITSETIKDAFKSSSYRYEYQLEAEISRGFRWRGGDGHAFEPIVANGAHACVLHNIANSGPMHKDQLTVVDVGASYQGYTADITRIYHAHPMSKRQQQIFETVVDVQSYALGLLKPGVLLAQYEPKVVNYLATKLFELGLPVDPTNENSVRHYYPHATSHFLGLNVHDVGDYGQPLKENVVLTVEPGIYIPEEGIGVRLEDDVLITGIGNKVLSGDLPIAL